MSKNERLNKLFEEWKTTIGTNESSFIKDGIINEHKFEQPDQTRILFLGKEPNSPEGGDWDFRVEWPKDPSWPHARQIKRWAYGILNKFPAWEEAQNPKENALLKVACMNVKKTGGGARSKYEEIEWHVNTSGKLIRRQVEIIDPDLIIGGLRGYHLWSKILDTDKLEECFIEGVKVFKWGRAKAIDFYHPSNRFPHSMQYALLSRIIGSAKFKEF